MELLKTASNTYSSVKQYFVDRKNYKYIKKLLVDVLDEDKVYVETLLKNTYDKTLRKIAQVIPVKIPLSNEVVLNIVKKMALNTLVLKNIVSVQPLTAPVGAVYLLRTLIENSNLTVKLETYPVLAKSKMHHAEISCELAQDLNTLHGLDPIKEMCTAIASDLSMEVVNGIITKLFSLANETRFSSNGLNFEEKLNNVSINIGRSTRRGLANFIITNPNTAAKIMMDASILKSFDVLLISENKSSTLSGLSHVANLVRKNKDNKIVYSLYVATQASDNKVLVGSHNENYDSGVVYAPFIPASFSPVINASTYAPVIKTVTRFDIFSDEYSKDYYRVFDYPTE